MSVSTLSMIENFITKFTYVFLFIHFRRKKNSATHIHVYSTVVKLKMMVILTFKCEFN